MTTPQAPETLLSMLHHSGKQHADKTAFVHFGRSLCALAATTAQQYNNRLNAFVGLLNTEAPQRERS